jgi:nucleotidyltransferase/DNA polymerase involved in DNA repair
MSTNFNNKQVMPDEDTLASEIGETKEILDRICRFIEDVTGQLSREWKHYGQKSGWTLKLLSKKRNLLFVGPEEGYFVIAFVFGDRAVEAVLKSELPDTIKNELANARKYAEGRGIRFEIKDDNQLESVFQLIRIKLEN